MNKFLKSAVKSVIIGGVCGFVGHKGALIFAEGCMAYAIGKFDAPYVIQKPEQFNPLDYFAFRCYEEGLKSNETNNE